MLTETSPSRLMELKPKSVALALDVFFVAFVLFLVFLLVVFFFLFARSSGVAVILIILVCGVVSGLLAPVLDISTNAGSRASLSKALVISMSPILFFCTVLRLFDFLLLFFLRFLFFLLLLVFLVFCLGWSFTRTGS